MSFSQDKFQATIIGNLVANPSIIENDNGSKTCYCRIATNPKARRFAKDGTELSPEERVKFRTVLDLKINKTQAAEKFMELLKLGDRVLLEGVLGTRKVKKGFWSQKEQRFVTITVDVDNDESNIQEIIEDRLVMWVYDFSKVLSSSGGKNDTVAQV